MASIKIKFYDNTWKKLLLINQFELYHINIYIFIIPVLKNRYL